MFMSFQTIGKDKNTEVKLTNAELHNDKFGYTLALTYRVESLDQVSEVHIPRVVLPFKNDPITVEQNYTGAWIDVGFGMTPILTGTNGTYFTTKVIKEKTKEMTLEEIEKKLGHKVKIVNK